MYKQSTYHEDIWTTDSDLATFLHTQLDIAAEVTRPFDKHGSIDGSMVSTLDIDKIPRDWYLAQPSLKRLVDWIKEELIAASSLLCSEQWLDLHVDRVWANRMNWGSSVSEHSHNNLEGLVGIFYFNAPENSAKLIVDDTLIVPKNAMLVIHDDKIMHRVTKHMSEEPRIVLIVEAVKN